MQLNVMHILIFLGLVFGASLGCILLESTPQLHPQVRRVGQILLCVAAGIYIGRFFGFLPV